MIQARSLDFLNIRADDIISMHVLVLVHMTF